MAISTGLAELARRGASTFICELEARYPEILRLIKEPPPPVVIELKGIDEARLLTDTGSKAIASVIKVYLR